MIEIDLSSFLRAFGIWATSQAELSLPSEAFKLSKSFVLVPSAHQRNGDFKLARWLKFNKISINVLSFFIGTYIKYLVIFPRNTLVCVVTQTSNFRGKEKTVVVFPLCLLMLTLWGFCREGEGYVLYYHSRHIAKKAGMSPLSSFS